MLNNHFIRVCFLLTAVCAINCCAISTMVRADLVVNFESFPLGSTAFTGPGVFKYQETVPTAFGDSVEDVSSIKVAGIENGLLSATTIDFSNRQTAFGSWGGFAISKDNDTTKPGYLNQYSSYAGSGADGSSNFAVAYGYIETQAGGLITPELVFDPTNVTQLNRLPSIYLPANYQAQSVAITNTTYAALAMRDGLDPAKQFGGASGSDPDFFKVSVYGIDASNKVISKNQVPSKIDFMLADYLSADNSQDYIVNTWQTLDLTALAGARSLHFNVSSSDIGQFGMNTPGYFAMDNLTLTAVPEPSSVVLALCAGLGFSCRYAKRIVRKNK